MCKQCAQQDFPLRRCAAETGSMKHDAWVVRIVIYYGLAATLTLVQFMFSAETEGNLIVAYHVASIKHVYWNVRRPLRHIVVTSHTCLPNHHTVPLSRNLGTSTPWNPLGHSRPVTGLLVMHVSSLNFPSSSWTVCGPCVGGCSWYVNHAVSARWLLQRW
jgi:hypothetical protein